ncbi:MAG: hypothetical protein AABW83_03370 [Nanoarchaeota archaeon]
MAKPKIYVVEGDITQIPADALMTAINSLGMWFGGIDGAIQRVAGNLYHNQVLQATPLSDLQTVVARGGARPDRKIGFRDVVFVVDDLKSPLEKVVYAGLETANDEGYKSLLIPTIRMGVMAGDRETPKQAVRKLADGLSDFVSRYSGRTKLEDIKVVVYDNPDLAKNISSVLGKI